MQEQIAIHKPKSTITIPETHEEVEEKEKEEKGEEQEEVEVRIIQKGVLI